MKEILFGYLTELDENAAPYALLDIGYYPAILLPSYKALVFVDKNDERSAKAIKYENMKLSDANYSVIRVRPANSMPLNDEFHYGCYLSEMNANSILALAENIAWYIGSTKTIVPLEINDAICKYNNCVSAENDRIIALCKEYAQKKKTTTLLQTTTYKGLPIGEWLSSMPADFSIPFTSGKSIRLRKKNVVINHRENYTDPQVIESWNIMYPALKTYVQEHNTVSIPSDMTVEGRNMRYWIKRLKGKYRKGNLPHEHYILLSELGIDFRDDAETKEQRWDYLLSLSEEYFIENGTIPQKTIYHNEPIGKWVSKQKSTYRKSKMNEDRIEKIKNSKIENLILN